MNGQTHVQRQIAAKQAELAQIPMQLRHSMAMGMRADEAHAYARRKQAGLEADIAKLQQQPAASGQPEPARTSGVDVVKATPTATAPVTTVVSSEVQAIYQQAMKAALAPAAAPAVPPPPQKNEGVLLMEQAVQRRNAEKRRNT